MNTALAQLTLRNTKLYFKDKSTFLASMISPMILFVLFVTFLGSVYEQSFLAIIPKGFEVSDSIVSSFTASWLLSSIIAVSSVTVAFCSNIIMVQDKINGSFHDLNCAPISRSTLAVSYFLGNFIATLIICVAAMLIGFLYLSFIGWYFSAADVGLIILDVVLCVLFGTSLAALVDSFVSTQGGIGAVSTLVSALYGFLCGAYMPISQFSGAIRGFISFMPGTYATGLLRTHYMNGVLGELDGKIPDKLITALKDGFDANLYFFDKRVQVWQMYSVLIAAMVVVMAVYIVLNRIRGKKIK